MISTGLPDPKGVYRTVGTTYTAMGLTAFGITALIIGLVPGGNLGFAYMAPFSLAVAWRIGIMGIHVEPDGVKVCDVFFSKRFAWREIDHFAVLPVMKYPWVGHVVLRDGRKIGSLGLSAGTREEQRLQVQKPIDELNKILEERMREIPEP